MLRVLGGKCDSTLSITFVKHGMIIESIVFQTFPSISIVIENRNQSETIVTHHDVSIIFLFIIIYMHVVNLRDMAGFVLIITTYV